MKVYDIGRNKYYQTKGWGAPNFGEEFNINFGKWMIEGFTRRRLFREVIDKHGKESGLSGWAMLEADAKRENGEWVYGDGMRRLNVQNWVNKLDGKFVVLYLKICNPKAESTIETEKSVVIHPGRIINATDLLWGKADLRLYLPGEGYLDTYRQLRRYIDKKDRH